MRDYHADPRKIEVIPPGVDLDFWRAERPRSAPKASPRVLFVGGDFVRKGGEVLLEALRAGLSERCQVDVVTDVDGVESSPNLRVHRGLGPSTPALKRLFDGADVFVLPTLAECSPWRSSRPWRAAYPWWPRKSARSTNRSSTGRRVCWCRPAIQRPWDAPSPSCWTIPTDVRLTRNPVESGRNACSTADETTRRWRRCSESALPTLLQNGRQASVRPCGVGPAGLADSRKSRVTPSGRPAPAQRQSGPSASSI